jgi:hypothetical protein
MLVNTREKKERRILFKAAGGKKECNVPALTGVELR